MTNNWVLKPDGSGGGSVRVFDAVRPGVSVGDEIESESTEQWGVVVGIICSKNGDPVCYKVWCRAMEGSGAGCFDYIAANNVTLREPCDSVQWSLERIGYQWIDSQSEEGTGYFYNMVTEDVVFW